MRTRLNIHQYDKSACDTNLRFAKLLVKSMPPASTPPIIPPAIEDVVASAGDYSVDAYYFISAGIHAASDRVHGIGKKAGSRHVSGRQLCETLRDLAIARWGMLAATVLRAWGIHSTRDFGVLVFAFVDAGHWQKTPNDSIDDFSEVYSFAEVFDRPYRVRLTEKLH